MRIPILAGSMGLSGAKGTYFFVLDVFIAASILVLTIIIILSSRVNVPDTAQNYLIAENFLNFMTSTQTKDLTMFYRNTLIADGNITNLDLYLHQQIAQWYYNKSVAEGLMDLPGAARHGIVAREFINQISTGIVPDQFGFSYAVNETVMYNRSNETRQQAEFLVVARKTTYFRIDDTTFFGPVNTTVEVWN